MPCIVSLASIKSTICRDVIAFNSTRSSLRNSISSSVAPCARSVSTRDSKSLIVTGSASSHIAETKAEVDHVDRVLVDVPAAITPERAEDREPGDVEIMEDEDSGEHGRQPC